MTDTITQTCERHGDYQAPAPIRRPLLGRIVTVCPTCAAEEQATAAAAAEAHRAAQDCRHWADRLDAAKVPPRFRDRTLDAYTAAGEGQRAALAFARTYAGDWSTIRETGRSAMFCGLPGTGKTHLAAGIALAWISAGASVRWSTVQGLVREIKDAWRADADRSERQVVAGYVEADLLVLDELGVQFGSAFEKDLLFGLLNDRYEHRRPCLLLTNLPRDAALELLGDRVADRLREDGGRVLVFDWQSHRGSATPRPRDMAGERDR